MNDQYPGVSTAVRERLRCATHTLHVRLNHNQMLAGLMTPAYPLSRYRSLLRTYFHVYRSLEERITRHIEKTNSTFDYASRRKLPWLVEDLNYFREEIPAFGQKTEIRAPAIENAGQMIGTLYVIEGSTLGGRIISQYLAGQYAFCGGAGTRFFRGYGEKTQSSWDEFLLFDESIATSEKMCAEAIRTAQAVFSLFEDALNDCLLSEGGG